MISKQLLRKRLSLAIGKQISPKDFTWFFAYFCEKNERMALKNVRKLTHDEVQAFSEFCGYDLHFPIPLPLLS